MALAGVLDQPLRVVNVGLELFSRTLEADGVAVVQVDWRPPAGPPDVVALLARFDDD